MHPKSKDRSGNAKVLSDAEKGRRSINAGKPRGRGRQSPYAARLQAIREAAAIKEIIRKRQAGDMQDLDVTDVQAAPDKTDGGEEE